MDGWFGGGWMNRLMMNEKIIDKRREDLFLIRKGLFSDIYHDTLLRMCTL